MTPSSIARTPVRTCVGCRARADTAELLRVVAVIVPSASVSGGSGPQRPAPPGATRLEPDPRRRAPGRGAWLHPDPTCVQTAQRRGALARALRVPGATDAAPVVAWVEQHCTTGTAPQDRTIQHNRTIQRNRMSAGEHPAPTCESE